MKPFAEHSGTYAWCALGVGVLAYDALCPQSQTLSETVDRGLENHRKLTVAGIGITALHLANALPEPIDPIHQIGVRARAFSEKYL